MHGGTRTSGIVGLQCVESVLQRVWHKPAMQEVIQLHVNNGTVDTLNGRRVAHCAFDAFAGSGAVTAVNASKPNLSNDYGMLSSWCRCLDVFNGCTEYFNVLLGKMNKNVRCGFRSGCISLHGPAAGTLNVPLEPSTESHSKRFYLLAGPASELPPNAGPFPASWLEDEHASYCGLAPLDEEGQAHISLEVQVHEPTQKCLGDTYPSQN